MRNNLQLLRFYRRLRFEVNIEVFYFIAVIRYTIIWYDRQNVNNEHDFVVNSEITLDSWLKVSMEQMFTWFGVRSAISLHEYRQVGVNTV